MKFLLIAAFVAVATAMPSNKQLVTPVAAGPAPLIIDETEPIAIGPAIINEFEPIAIGPAIVDHFEPIAVGPAIVDTPTTNPAPSTAPLVQIILNINTPIAPVAQPPRPVPVPDFELTPELPASPEIEPVQVVDIIPIAVEPVIVETPVLPSPVVTLPEELN